MLKKEKIIIIMLFISSIIVTVLGFILTYIKVDLSEPTADEFISIMEEIGCSINTEYNDAYDYIDSYLITKSDTCSYLISYIKFNNDEKKDATFNSLVDEVLSSENINSKYHTKFLNHAEYTITNNTNFKAVTLEKNTIIFLSTEEQNKDKSIDILHDLKVRYKPNFKYLLIAFLGFMLFVISALAFCLTFNKKNI